ncbi:MAG: hypothetical protein V2J55_04280 [Candidatus Competibacteraceae bacterium]|nr:hypothetical protein [Candidatus Competibacteraceae bacterium]
MALFPVLRVILYGTGPERTVLHLAGDLRDKLEGLPDVSKVDIAGGREELLEVVVDPVRLDKSAR